MIIMEERKLRFSIEIISISEENRKKKWVQDASVG